MPKVKYRDTKKDTNMEALTTRRFYETKFYGLFLNAYKFNGISREQAHYLLKSMWMRGTCAAFIIPETKPFATSMQAIRSNSSPASLVLANENKSGVLCFVPYAASNFNIDDFPSVINLVSKRGATFVPKTYKNTGYKSIMRIRFDERGKFAALEEKEGEA